MNIFLVRHGQDDESVRGGWCNHGLIELGKKQSQLLGQQLKTKSFDKVYASDLKRAVETVEIISDNLTNKTEITFTSELREINNGLLAGMKNELAEEIYPNLYYRGLDFEEKYPEGESPKEFYQRVATFWKEKILTSTDENILIVTHGGVINIILHLYNNLPYSNQEAGFPVKTGTITEIFLNT